MTRKKISEKIEDFKVEGKEINAYLVDYKNIDEPISANICDAVSDFYNVMHLIKNCWTNKKYILNMRNLFNGDGRDYIDGIAGYNIFSKSGNLEAWIGIREKRDCLEFSLYDGEMYYEACELYSKGLKGLKGAMGVYGDENWWGYAELKLSDIFCENSEKKQRKIVKAWIKGIMSQIEEAGKLPDRVLR
jgi:hypothetical protein